MVARVATKRLLGQQPRDEDNLRAPKYNDFSVSSNHGPKYLETLGRLCALVEKRFGGHVSRRGHGPLYTAVRINKSSWYRKITGTTEFTIDEFFLLAEELKMPLGWPFLPDEYVTALRPHNETPHPAAGEPPGPPPADPVAQPGRHRESGHK